MCHARTAAMKYVNCSDELGHKAVKGNKHALKISTGEHTSISFPWHSRAMLPSFSIMPQSWQTREGPHVNVNVDNYLLNCFCIFTPSVTKNVEKELIKGGDKLHVQEFTVNMEV